MLLSPENIITKTSQGLLIYEYILLEKFPKKDIRSLLRQGRPLPNPFVSGGQLAIRLHNGVWNHEDLQLPAFKGTAFDFANHYYKLATLPELCYLLNQNLRLGLKIPSEELLDQLNKSEMDSSFPKLSFFRPPISNTRPSETLNLPQIFKRITGEEYRKQTEALRQLEDRKEARQYKATHFPYVTFAGCFEKRSDTHLLQPSGLMVIDLDDLQELNRVKEALIAEREYETELLFTSPSGRGLKWVTSYPHLEIGHQDYFQILCSYLEAVFGLTPDFSGRDISRACFINFDPEAVLSRRYLFSGERRVERGEFQ